MSNLFVLNFFFLNKIFKNRALLFCSWQLKECPEKKFWSSWKILGKTCPKIENLKNFSKFFSRSDPSLFLD